MSGYHAILIGINTYRKKPLKGCVQDVQDFKAYLEATVPSVNIQMFTATGNTEPGLTSPIEDPKFWPTIDNIRAAFDKVSRLAKAGDAVYIHYSGHGTHEEPSDTSQNRSTGDLALVVLNEEVDKPEKYIWGQSLAYHLNAMIMKGLTVTLTLDCCFSASIYRSDPQIRFLPYDREIISVAQSETDWAPPKSGFNSSANREVFMLSNWLMDPDKYAVFVACGPSDEAGEIEFDSGKVVGKLSHFLLKVLKEDGGVSNTVNHIYERLRSEYRTGGQAQSAVLYGNKIQGFFGRVRMEKWTKGVAVSEKPDGALELQAGLAHGVGTGDEFALYPSAFSTSMTHGKCAAVQVTYAGAFASSIEKLSAYSATDQGRWMAEPLSQGALRKYTVCLASQFSRLDELRTALEKRSLDSHMESENKPFSFRITTNSDEIHEVYDGSGHTSMKMLTMFSRKASADEISGTLEHLARFKLVEDLSNTNASETFRKSFDIHIISQGVRCEPHQSDQDRIQITEGNKLELIVQNHGKYDLYLSAYDLGPSWQVEHMGSETYSLISPKGDDRDVDRTYKNRFRTKIPDDVREKQDFCDDTVKVFITSYPTSFDFLELPRLSEFARVKIVDRTENGDNCLEGDWVGLSFHIRTSVSS